MAVQFRTIEGRKIFFAIAVMIVGLLMTTGLGAFLSPKLGPAVGYFFGLLIAIVIEGVFTISLSEWRSTGSIEMLIIAAVFGLASVCCDAPVIFSVIRGGGLTTEAFNDALDRAVHDVTLAQMQVHAGSKSVHDLAQYEEARRNEEGIRGGTCNMIGAGARERYRFRKRDAEDFAIQAAALDEVDISLSKTLASIRTLRATPGGSELGAALRVLNAEISEAAAAANNKDLVQIAQHLEQRAASDGSVQHDAITKVRFVCPDPTVATRARAIAEELRNLPSIDKHIAVVDMTQISNTMVELPVRLLGNELSGYDISALVLSCVFEIMLIGATLATHGRGLPGHRLRQTARRLDGFKDIDYAGILGVGFQLPVEVAAVRSLIERFMISKWPFSFVLVAHDSGNSAQTFLTQQLQHGCAAGWAARYHLMPRWLVNWWVRGNTPAPYSMLPKWLLSVDIVRAAADRKKKGKRWPTEMRNRRIEVFRVNLRMLDELQLAARVQTPPDHDNRRATPDYGDVKVVHLPKVWTPDVAAE